MPEFEILGCHANRAGHAGVTLKHVPSGATVSVHQIPFEHDYGETVGQECQRIRLAGGDIAQRAVQFLGERQPQDPGPEASTPSAAPNADEPPNAFGQPLDAQ
jgi:hypothetical protein